MSEKSEIKIYHNPACTTSRNVLEIIRSRGYEPVVIEYLKTPLGRSQITALLKRMNIAARDLMRDKERIYQELGLADPKWTQEQLIDFMAQHPVLMNRPIVETSHGALLCRPKEVVLDLLP